MATRNPLSVRLAATMPAAALGGGLAATLDVLAARPQLARFLSDGPFALWLFLTALYGAALAIALLLAALLTGGLVRATLLGRLFDESPQPERVSSWGLAASAAVSLGLLSGGLFPLTQLALQRFHHRGLLAILVASGAGGIFLGAAALGLLVLSLLPKPAEGQGISLRFAGPRSLYVLGWSAGILGLCAAIFFRILKLQQTPILTNPQRALQLSLWAPILALVALGIGHVVGRTLARLVRRFEARRGLDSLAALGLLPGALLLLAGAVVALAYGESLRILDWRPLRTAGVAIVGSLFALELLWRRARSSWRLAFVLPVVLYVVALSIGRTERVRKAALSLAPLSEQLVLGISRVADLDGDGVAGRLAIGGSDCDDFDAERHPGAFDWPDNGIDENCNGHDATANPTRSAAPVPAALPPGLQTRPNIVLITIDALRADHLSAYGYARRTTPNLDALAADASGVLCESAWAHAPSTRYSVPAILTGRYPSTVAWGPPHIHWPPEVLPENRLISEMLGERGYSTTALLTYHYFERSWGLAQGFADYDTHLMTLHSLGGDPAATSGTSARELADLALEKLTKLTASDEKPFFLWLHFYDPHYRYETHLPPPGESSFGDGEVDLYDGEVRYTDQHIGRVLDFLRQSPAWPRTAVIVTSDHGEGFGEHGIGPDRRHGYHLYANQTRVPMILRLPGLAGAQRIATPVGHVDLAPTLVQLATGEDPSVKEPQLLGRSILPRLADPARGRDAVVFQEVMYEGPTVRKAITDGRWHLIQNLIPDGTNELYDLKSDPGEDHDRFGHEPRAEQALGQQLAAWLDDSAVPPNFAQRIAGNLSPQPIAAATPVGAQIGDALEVVAFDGPKDPVARGSGVTLTVIYRVRKRIEPGYRLFTHLRSPSGRSLNLDHDFVDGLVPPQRLQPGSYVRDVVRAVVPPWFPAGPAKLVVGLFRRDTRAPVSGPDAVVLRGDRAVQAATFEVR